MSAVQPGHVRELVERYGALMPLKDVAEVLRYPSVHAARQARRRGQFPVQLIRIPNRRGWWASTRSVAEYLVALLEGP
jgi:hypothetical protein